MRRLNVFFAVVTICTLISCNKQCPPFNRELLSWLPHSVNDTLTFVNNQHDTLPFIINESDVYDDNTTYGKYEKYGCGSVATVSANLSQNPDNKIRERVHYGNAEEIHFIISINFDDKRGEFSLSTMDVNEIVTPSIVIDNHEYSNVLIFETDTIKYPNLSDFWKLIISKDIGIVKVYGRGSSNAWTLLE